jgi:hypothetical protein
VRSRMLQKQLPLILHISRYFPCLLADSKRQSLIFWMRGEATSCRLFSLHLFKIIGLVSREACAFEE